MNYHSVAACEPGPLSSGSQFICLKNVRIDLLFSSDIPKIGTQSKEYIYSQYIGTYLLNLSVHAQY